jgi:hypothetical protein
VPILGRDCCSRCAPRPKNSGANCKKPGCKLPTVLHSDFCSAHMTPQLRLGCSEALAASGRGCLTPNCHAQSVFVQGNGRCVDCNQRTKPTTTKLGPAVPPFRSSRACPDRDDDFQGWLAYAKEQWRYQKMARTLNRTQELGELQQDDILMASCADSVYREDGDSTDSESEAANNHSATVRYMQLLEQPLPPEISKEDDFKAWLWHSKALWRLQYARRKHYQSMLAAEPDYHATCTATKLALHPIDREIDMQGWLEFAKALWQDQLRARRQRRAQKLAQETEAPIVHPRKTGRPMILPASTSSAMCPPSAIVQPAASPASQLPVLLGTVDKNKPKRTPTSNPWTGRGRVYLRNPVTGFICVSLAHLVGSQSSSRVCVTSVFVGETLTGNRAPTAAKKISALLEQGYVPPPPLSFAPAPPAISATPPTSRLCLSFTNHAWLYTQTYECCLRSRERSWVIFENVTSSGKKPKVEKSLQESQERSGSSPLPKRLRVDSPDVGESSSTAPSERHYVSQPGSAQWDPRKADPDVGEQAAWPMARAGPWVAFG